MLLFIAAVGRPRTAWAQAKEPYYFAALFSCGNLPNPPANSSLLANTFAEFQNTSTVPVDIFVQVAYFSGLSGGEPGVINMPVYVLNPGQMAEINCVYMSLTAGSAPMPGIPDPQTVAVAGGLNQFQTVSGVLVFGFSNSNVLITTAQGQYTCPPDMNGICVGWLNQSTLSGPLPPVPACEFSMVGQPSNCGTHPFRFPAPRAMIRHVSPSNP
jgi:hypothetical protein